MYAKPIINGGTGEESRARENVKDATDRTLTGLSQYSLLGNDKYENVAMDLKKIKAAPWNNYNYTDRHYYNNVIAAYV